MLWRILNTNIGEWWRTSGVVPWLGVVPNGVLAVFVAMFLVALPLVIIGCVLSFGCHFLVEPIQHILPKGFAGVFAFAFVYGGARKAPHNKVSAAIALSCLLSAVIEVIARLSYPEGFGAMNSERRGLRSSCFCFPLRE